MMGAAGAEGDVAKPGVLPKAKLMHGTAGAGAKPKVAGGASVPACAGAPKPKLKVPPALPSTCGPPEGNAKPVGLTAEGCVNFAMSSLSRRPSSSLIFATSSSDMPGRKLSHAPHLMRSVDHLREHTSHFHLPAMSSCINNVPKPTAGCSLVASCSSVLAASTTAPTPGTPASLAPCAANGAKAGSAAWWSLAASVACLFAGGWSSSATSCEGALLNDCVPMAPSSA
mmetsp:Transcript_24111/g.69361  ORF Transcript_24111/g.69361 Transcript_24111/m.69361 type:complete len:227 (+) Transcript_24111:740-1420(+)